MNADQQQGRLDEAFERIEGTILPCIAMMLETLLDASAGLATPIPRRGADCRRGRELEERLGGGAPALPLSAVRNIPRRLLGR